MQYYRARYETEGIRGPLKGLDNNHPAVQVCMHVEPCIVSEHYVLNWQ